MERKIEVRVIKVERYCSNCATGLMRPTGIVLTTHPAQYPHVCAGGVTGSSCGHAETFKVQYPYIEYVPINKNAD